MGAGMRKIVVLHRIEKLPTEERQRAHDLYHVLDDIEFCTYAPFPLGAYIGVVLLFLTTPLLEYLLTKMLPGRDIPFLLLGAVIDLFFSSALGVFFLKRLVFNPRRSKRLDELQTMLHTDLRLHETLATLLQLDPEMARTIRRFIPQTV